MAILKRFPLVKYCIVCVVSILCYCLYPIMLGLFLPFGIARAIAKQVARWDPTLGNILSCQSSAIAGPDNVYTNPSNVIVNVLELKQKLDIQQVLSVARNVLPDNEKPSKYPELKQKIVTRYGYLFHQSVPNFRVDNHVRFLNPENTEKEVNRDTIRTVLHKLLKQPFTPGLSPWEFILVPNYVDGSDPTTKSAVIFRAHHCICDAYSILNFIGSLAVRPWKSDGERGGRQFRMGFHKQLLLCLRIAVTAPYHVMFKSATFSNPPIPYTHRRTGDTPLVARNAELIPISLFKNVKNGLGVSFSSVIIGVMAQAVAKALNRRNIRICKVPVVMPWPMPGHPDKMTNYFGFTRMTVTVDPDVSVTIRNVHKTYEWVRTSSGPILSLYMSRLMGSFPVSMIPKADSLEHCLCLLSTGISPPRPIDVFGYEIKHFVSAITLQNIYAIVALGLSYNGYYDFAMDASSALLPDQEDADLMVSDFENILSQLEQLVVKDTARISME